MEVGDITKVASDEIKENTVIDSDPKAGKKVRKGTKVDLRVSSGKTTVDMPNFIGMDEETVKRNVSKLGFKNVTVEKVASDRYDSGKVVAQSIPAGTQIVPKEKELIIQVSTGKKKVSMPNLVGISRAEAKSIIDTYGFRSVSYKEEYSDKEKEGTVISQSIRSGSSIIPSEEILEIIVSKGKEETNKGNNISDQNNKNNNNSENSNNTPGNNSSGN